MARFSVVDGLRIDGGNRVLHVTLPRDLHYSSNATSQGSGWLPALRVGGAAVCQDSMALERRGPIRPRTGAGLAQQSRVRNQKKSIARLHVPPGYRRLGRPADRQRPRDSAGLTVKFPTGEDQETSHGARKSVANPRKGTPRRASRIQRHACDRGGSLSGRSSVAPIAFWCVSECGVGGVVRSIRSIQPVSVSMISNAATDNCAPLRHKASCQDERHRDAPSQIRVLRPELHRLSRSLYYIPGCATGARGGPVERC